LDNDYYIETLCMTKQGSREDDRFVIKAMKSMIL